MIPKPFTLYRIKDIDYDAIVAKYRQLCEEGEMEVDDSCVKVYSKAQSEIKYIVKHHSRKPLRDDKRIKNKAMFLVHAIAYRQQTSRDNNSEGSPIQYSVLQDVLGEDAYELLKSLIQLNYITVSRFYEVGKTSKKYKVLQEITSEQSTNFDVLKYIEKSRHILRDKVLKRLKSASFTKEYGDTFADIYLKNLNKFKIADKTGFDDFVTARIKENPNTEAYYEYVKEGFNNELKIYSIDDNNRIYHILTSLKRELKKYVNILFSIDCSNSHPILFNYFIFLSKGITISDSYAISSALSTIPSSEISTSNTINHNDTKKIIKVLINKGVEESKIARFKEDELLYLWQTINGFFWDDILSRHKLDDLDRHEIKQKMFAEVFYSKSPKIAWKAFAKEFKMIYPNVYELISKWKEPLKNEDTKKILLRRHKAVEVCGRIWMKDESTALPNIMMDLESVIFRDILKSLFSKRICAVHIHDAIVIPSIKSTQKIDPDRIQIVMRDVYKRFGLHPSFKVEAYVK